MPKHSGLFIFIGIIIFVKKILRKAGFPLFYLSIFGFSFASRSDGMLLSYISMGLMLAAMVLVVASAFIAPDKEDAEGGAGAPAAPAPAREPSFPPPTGIDVASAVPPWVYIVGAVISAAGAVVFFTGPDGMNQSNVISFSLIPGGILYILGATFFYGDPADRRNILRGAVALVSGLVIIGGFMALVFIAAGAFDPGQGKPYGILASVLILVGMGGAYYGLKYQQSAEGRAIGRELGFVDADGGERDDVYDSKGVIDGLETLFNVEQTGPGKNSRAFFRLDVLCRCQNSQGLKLSVRPEGPLGVSFGSLPRLPEVPYWDFYVVRCDQPETAMRLLPEARKGSNIFNDEAGFLEMTLDGSGFKFTFRTEGYAGTAYVRRVLQETSRLASLFH